MSTGHDIECDVFLSFSPEDNVPVDGAPDPCVAFLTGVLQQVAARNHRELRIRSARDPGATTGSTEIAPSTVGAALFIAVLSQNYVESLDGPMEAGEFEGWAGGPVASKSRMFTVVCSPIEDRSMIFPALQDVRTYDLFGEDGVPTRGHLTSAAVSLAMDVVAALDEFASGPAESAGDGATAPATGETTGPSLSGEAAASPADETTSPPSGEAETAARRGGSKPRVFLAHTETRLRRARQDLRHELERRGVEVVPAGEPRPTKEEIETDTAAGLSGAMLSVHLLGGAYDEPADLECAEAGRHESIERMVWIEAADEPEEREANLLKSAELVRRVESAAERTTVFRAVSTPLKAFETEVVRRLRQRTAGESEPDVTPGGPESLPFVYLCYESSDVEWRRQLGELLADARLRPRWPDWTSESTRVRRQRHDRNLRTSNGVVVVVGEAPIEWLQTVYDDLEDAGLSDMPLALCMVDPMIQAKTEFLDPQNPPILAGARVTREQLADFVERVRSYRRGAA